MAESTAPVLVLGTLTLGRQMLIEEKPLDWRVVIGTGVLAGLSALGEKALGRTVPALAWLAVATVALTRPAKGKPSIAEAALTYLQGKQVIREQH